MEKESSKTGFNITINDSQIKLVGIMFLFFLLASNKKPTNKFNLKEISEIELQKKSRLLNRIKGYMKAEEQYIVHRAEVILEIISRVKSLLEGPQLQSAEVQYQSLSLEDRKRNMLMDLSAHMKEEDRDIINTAIELDIKARNIEKQMRELHNLSQEGISINNIEKLIDAIDPLLEGEMKEKTKDIKKITSMFKVIRSLDNKGSLNENDLLEIIAPHIEPQQRESLMKMMQIAKAVSSSMNNNEVGDTKDSQTTEEPSDPSQNIERKKELLCMMDEASAKEEEKEIEE
ncbi:hypothetical protein SAMN05660297_03573 [Natronincola peptidivorans]|uniref:Uncharacterized protein n=1 Tax=Natronincola peptidivorans TaxID=426128 RepID=A0A1I0HCR1_9FIRM|nr:hypothetical protein [Natronincola peptidivorans]SET80757.1 hypothetical protein SAMN05660297_03573 [Natronincola peptidivorans]